MDDALKDISNKADFTFGPLLAIFVLGFTTLVLILWYSSQKQKYWKRAGIPYVKPYPIVGNVLENIKKPLHGTELERYNKYGRIYGHYEGNRALLSVADPELIRNILVKDFHAFTERRKFSIGEKILDRMISSLRGEDWKRVRAIVTPTFTTGKIKRMMSIFQDCSRTLVQNFKGAAEKGKPIDAKLFYGAFTMDMIASCAFSTKIDSHNNPQNPFVVNARALFSRNLNWRFVVFTLMPSVMKALKISIFGPKIMEFFTAATLQIIEERKRTGQKRNDFLQLLMDTANEVSDDAKLEERDNVMDNYRKDENSDVFKQSNLSKKSLSQDEVIAQCVVFFLAGYDSTASTLSFVSYLLALHPDIQEKLIGEVDDVLRETKGEFTYEAVQNMKYLDNVISETLRLYPPGLRLERVAEEDYKVGDTGLTLLKDMMVTIPVYAMHRDPEFFPDPEKFDPDRFKPEEREKRKQYVYMPFGAGPRNCIGIRFALIQVKMGLAYVLSNFRVKRCPQTKVPLDYYNGQTILQPKDVTLLFEVRKDAVKAL